MNKEVSNVVQVYEAFHKYSPRIGCSLPELVPIPSTRSFAQRGTNLVPLPRSTDQRTHIIVDIDYSLKYVEVKELALTTKFKLMEIVKSRIILRYGIPSILTSENAL